MHKFNQSIPTIVVTVDASFDQESGVGTAAYHIQSDYKIVARAKVLGRVKANTQAELVGALESLKAVIKEYPHPCNVRLVTDCMHVQQVLTNIENAHNLNYKRSKNSKYAFAGEREDVLKQCYQVYNLLNFYAVRRKPRNSTEALAWCDKAAHGLLGNVLEVLDGAMLENYHCTKIEKAKIDAPIIEG